MALTRVELTPDVFTVCATHALTTESEEVMGLLLGDVHYGSHGEAVAHILKAIPQIRTDRRKDRVEASPEQLASAMAMAEKLSEGSESKVRVIGWYHSHPHITVLPSHVDIRTQGSYQMLDEGFVGIIISTFNQGMAECSQHIQVTAFQSVQQTQRALSPKSSYEVDSPLAKALAASAADARQQADAGVSWTRREVPLTVSAELAHPGCQSGGLRLLLKVLFEEERQAFMGAISAASDEYGKVDPLTAMHHAGVYQQHLCRLMEVVAGPVVSSLRALSAQASLQLEQLQETKAALLNAAARSTGSGSEKSVQISYIDLPQASTAAVSAGTSEPQEAAAVQQSAPASAAAAPADDGGISRAWALDGSSSSRGPGGWAHWSNSWEQDTTEERQQAASAWQGGHDPYDAGLVTISQAAPAAGEPQKGAVKGAPNWGQGQVSSDAWVSASWNERQGDGPSDIPNGQQQSQPTLVPTASPNRYMPQLVSHPLPDQARSTDSPTTHSANPSPLKISVKAAGQQQALPPTGGDVSGERDSGDQGGGKTAAADKGSQQKKGFWHRSKASDPFAGLLDIPSKVVHGSRKKSPEAGRRGKRSDAHI